MNTIQSKLSLTSYIVNSQTSKLHLKTYMFEVIGLDPCIFKLEAHWHSIMGIPKYPKGVKHECFEKFGSR